MIEHKIGETFWWHVDPDTNVRLKVVEDEQGEICDNCFFYCKDHFSPALKNHLESCTPRNRRDQKFVHFEEVK